MTLKEMREARQAAFRVAEEIMKAAEADGSRELTEDESTKYNTAMDEVRALDTKITQREDFESTRDRLNVTDQRQSTAERFDGEGESTLEARDRRDLASDRACAKVIVPARCRPMHRMDAFRNTDEGRRDAYISAMWLMGAVFGNQRCKRFCKDLGLQFRFVNESTNTGGGFLVPHQFEKAIIDLREQVGLARQECGYMPMTGDTASIPKRKGGITAYFVAENKEITASDPSWQSVGLTARKLAALTRISSEISEDAAVSVADIVAREFAYAFAAKEDACLIDGDGSATYGGITGIRPLMIDGDHDASFVDAPTGDDDFADYLDVTLMSMVGQVPDYPGLNEKWFTSKLGWGATFLRLIRAAGGATGAELAAGIQKAFAGYEVVTNTALPSTQSAAVHNNVIALFFGDLSKAATYGDRRGITVKIANEKYIEYDQIGLQATERFDITVHDIGDGSTSGPIVGLKGNT